MAGDSRATRTFWTMPSFPLNTPLNPQPSTPLLPTTRLYASTMPSTLQSAYRSFNRFCMCLCALILPPMHICGCPCTCLQCQLGLPTDEPYELDAEFPSVKSRLVECRSPPLAPRTRSCSTCSACALPGSATASSTRTTSASAAFLLQECGAYASQDSVSSCGQDVDVHTTRRFARR